MTRRDALFLLSAAGAAGPARAMTVSELVARNDELVASYLERQNTDPTSRWRAFSPRVSRLFSIHNRVRGTGTFIKGIRRFSDGAAICCCGNRVDLVLGTSCLSS